MLEGKGRRLSRKQLDQDLAAQREDDLGVDYKIPKKISATKPAADYGDVQRELVADTPAREGLHTIESITELVARKADRFEEWGYRSVTVNPSATVRAYNKDLYAVRITVRDIGQDRIVQGWITIAISNDGTASYRCSLNNEILDTVSLPKDVDVSGWLEAESQAAKVVKSRPMWLYPEMFHLPPEEVWPKGAKVAVIGDPYQACDRDGVTIIEYEYADELVPPVLYAHIKQETPFVSGWLSQLCREDVEALERLYNGLVASRANPYAAFVERCFTLAQSIGEHMLAGVTDHSIQRAQLRKL